MRTLPRIRKRNARLSDFAKKKTQQSNRKSNFEILQNSCFERIIRTYQTFENTCFKYCCLCCFIFLRFSRNIKLNIKYVIWKCRAAPFVGFAARQVEQQLLLRRHQLILRTRKCRRISSITLRRKCTDFQWKIFSVCLISQWQSSTKT